MAASFQTPKHKSTPIQSQDEWTVREKLSLASSVMRSGDQNWVSVSRAIKPINETGRCGKVRPPEFFSQKNCAILYSQMLEKVNTPKRKRTSETGAGETPGEQIVRRLTFERIEELKKSMKTDQLTYRKLKMRIEDIRNGKIDQQLPAIWEEIQARKRRMEEMQQMQVSTSGSSSGGDSSTSPLPAGSPVAPFPMSSTPLFGGLKQATQATTPSPQKGKQLRIPKPTPKFQKYQQQLQQRHQAGQHATPSGSPGDIGGMRDPTKYPVDGPRFGFDSEPLKSEPMDIDPKTAVQTVSVDMPPTPQETSIPKAEPGVVNPTVQVQPRRPSAGSISGTESLKSLLSQPPKESLIELSLPMKKSESFTKKGTDTLHPTLPTSQPKDIDNSMITPPVAQATTNKQLTDSKSFLGQKSPMENHKVDSIRDRITPAAPSVTAPTLSKLLSSQASPTNASTLMNSVPPANSFIEKPLSSKAIDSNISITSDISGPGRGVISVGGKGEESGVTVTSISVNPKAAISDVIPSPIAMTPPPVTPPAEKKEIISETLVKIVEPTPAQPNTKEIEDITIKEETEELSVTADHTLQPENKIEIVDTPQPSPRVTGRTRAPKPGRPGRPRGRRSQRRSKSVTSTDNETEMEEEKEEDTKSETIEVESEKASEKDEEDDDMESTISEKKDDSEEEEHESIDDGYSESGDRSKEYLERASTIGSESVPASPASQTSQGDMDPESLQAQKTWKKSIMLVWRAAANHKYANVFLHAVTDDEAPGYHSIVFRPMDLTTIKKNIENGTIRTTSEFQRDMMLMFQNALMYNSSDHDVYRMAEEMRDDVMDQIQSYIATQLMVQSSDRDSTKMLRGHRADVFHFFL